MESVGAYKGVVAAIWHGCAPTKPGRIAEAWRQKRTQSCRLTRRASPSVRTGTWLQELWARDWTRAPRRHFIIR